MRYDGHELEKDKPEFAQAIEERTKYGVSTVDTWGFDSYLLAVLTNGLQKLADEAHGWPAGPEWPTFEGWCAALKTASDDAYWLLVTVDELENEAYSKAYPKEPEDFKSIEDYLNAEAVSPQAVLEWKKELREINGEREVRKDRLFTFISKNLWALWD
jgi:hypothetical protein